MTDAFLITLFFGCLAVFGYMAIWGFDQILLAGVRKRLRPDETVLFESRASRSNIGPALLLGPRYGFVAVTRQRLIMAFWKTFLPVRTVEEIRISDIDEANIYRAFNVSTVHVTSGSRKLLLVPKVNRFWPYAKQPAQQFVQALQQASSGRIATLIKSGFKDMIRAQVEHKR